MPRLPFLFLMLCMPLIVGCEGCRRDPATKAEDEEKKKEAAKEDFSARPPLPFPADASVAGSAIKPGHWLTASQTLQANKFDARGELESRVDLSGVSLRSGDETGISTTVPNQRPVVMPKGQRRRFDYRLLPPLPTSSEQKRCSLSSRFVSSGQSMFFEGGQQPFAILRPEEYFFVILTTRPERFAKLEDGDWVRPKRGEFDAPAETSNYRIVTPSTKDLVPLAETMLDWTSTAVVLWDDVPADSLTPDQQIAMGDWLRFGGRLIVNGADAADSITRTSLQDALPLIPSGNIELDPEAAESLLEGWQVKTDPSTKKQVAVIRGQSGRVALDGTLADGAEPVPRSGKLVLKRLVGRGTVVQPRFDITSDWIANWESYDSFVNAVLISRPPRAYFQADSDGVVRQRYPLTQRLDADAETNTDFRIFSRDTSLRLSKKASSDAGPGVSGDGVARSGAAGVGGWDDNSDVIALCREILRSESGIEIPKSSLVIRSLGIYLCLLVPINYLVFRLMGRLEYAWLAVPVIAIGGAVWVARAARLDIGFARSQTELAVLELQPGYARGHLTRVIAMYNSLSSTYDVDFKTIDGAAMPMNAGRMLGASETLDQAQFRTSYQEGPTLAGIAVGSNQVRLLRTEQVIDVSGGISIAAERLVNDSSLDLLDVVVIGKDLDGRTRVAVVGGCSPGQTSSLRFRETENIAVSDELPMQAGRLIRKFASSGTIKPGTVRLVGRVDGRMDGVSIAPLANQQNTETIVVAHLQHAVPPVSEPDQNLMSDFRVKNTLSEQSVDDAIE